MLGPLLGLCRQVLAPVVVGMLRHRRDAPHRPEVLDLRLDALHAAAGSRRRRRSAASRRPPAARRGSKLMASSDSTASFSAGRCRCSLAPSTRSKRSAARRRVYSAEPALAAAVQASAQSKRLPMAAKRLSCRQVGEVADLQHGVLEVRRDHRQSSASRAISFSSAMIGSTSNRSGVRHASPCDRRLHRP